MERDPKGPEKDVSSKTGESAVNDYQFSFTQILTSNERVRALLTALIDAPSC